MTTVTDIPTVTDILTITITDTDTDILMGILMITITNMGILTIMDIGILTIMDMGIPTITEMVMKPIKWINIEEFSIILKNFYC